jgi:spore coat polysaccharide biosynthesis protein SpsF (cytidylyltransferase family)
MEDLTGLAKDERDMAGFEDDVDTEEEVADMVYYDEDLAGMDVEDSEAVAEAENKKDMGVTAEHIRLPIRSASEHTTAMAHGNPAIDTNLYVQTPKAWTDAKPQPMTLADLHEDQKFFLSLTQHLPEDVSSRYKNAISKWQDRLAKNLSKEADKLENGSGD